MGSKALTWFLSACDTTSYILHGPCIHEGLISWSPLQSLPDDMSDWTPVHLRDLLPLADDTALVKTAELLNEPESHLPPATFNELAQAVGAVRLDEDALRSWRREHEPAFQRRAIQILRGGDDVARCRMEENLRVLAEVLSEIRSAKAEGTRRLRDEDVAQAAEERLRAKLLSLEKRVIRTIAKYAYRLQILEREQEHLDQTGEVRAIPPISPEPQLTIGEKRVRLLGRLIVDEGRDVESFADLVELLHEHKDVATKGAIRKSLAVVEVNGQPVYVPGSSPGRREVDADVATIANIKTYYNQLKKRRT